MITADTPLQVLGLPGSLRKQSFNRRLLEIASDVAPSALQVSVYGNLADVPLFNEDLEGEDNAPPPSVAHLRRAVQEADVLLIATPEYNQSMPAVVKNAIDWLSRAAPTSVLVDKPVALCGITSGEWGTRLSQAALRQTLFACGARLQPLHLYLRKAESAFEANTKADQSIESQMAAFLKMLVVRLAPASTPLALAS